MAVVPDYLPLFQFLIIRGEDIDDKQILTILALIFGVLL